MQDEINREVQHAYSPNAIDLILNQPRMGEMEHATASGSSTNDEGEMIAIYLSVSNKGIIEKATFTTTGCKPSIAPGAQAAIMLTGNTIDQARTITKESLLKGIGKFPLEHHGYVLLTVNAIQDALNRLRQDMKVG